MKSTHPLFAIKKNIFYTLLLLVVFILSMVAEIWAGPMGHGRRHNSRAFQGHHGQHVLFIIDEAITTPPAIFRAIEGSLLDGGSRLLCTYNPTTTIGSEVYQMEQDHGG